MKNILCLILAIHLQCYSQSKKESEFDKPNLHSIVNKEELAVDSVKLNIWATYYYVPTVLHDKKGIEMLDANEKKTGLKLSLCDLCRASIEGTVFIKKQKETFVLNYAGRSKTIQYDCRKCSKYKNYDRYIKTGKVLWGISSGFGRGVKNFKLVPFKSIAVDSSIIPYGSVLYIPEAKGISYTDVDGFQKKHDGYFFAADTGSKIIGNHIDVFIGAETINPFSFVKSNKNKTFEAYILKNELLRLKLAEIHK